MTMLDANGDVAKQNKDVQDLITKGIKALILNPANPEAVQPQHRGREGSRHQGHDRRPAGRVGRRRPRGPR